MRVFDNGNMIECEVCGHVYTKLHPDDTSTGETFEYTLGFSISFNFTHSISGCDACLSDPTSMTRYENCVHCSTYVVDVITSARRGVLDLQEEVAELQTAQSDYAYDLRVMRKRLLWYQRNETTYAGLAARPSLRTEGVMRIYTKVLKIIGMLTNEGNKSE